MIERRTRTAARRLRARRAGRLAFAALALAAAVVAEAADAARLVKVRVGRHAGFVRVVFETDAPARFAIEPRAEPAEALVRIDAADAPAQVSAPPGAGAEVRLEALPDGGTRARIRAREPVVVESQVLPGPPRIVFDLRPGAPEIAVAPPEPPAVEAPPIDDAEPDAIAELLEEEPAEPPEAEAPPAAEAERPPPVLAPEIREPSIFSELAPPLEPEAEPGAPREVLVAEPEPEPVAPPATEPALPAEEQPPTSPEPPAVSAPPPAALTTRLDDRSLVLGAAGGLALGLGLALLARGRGHGAAAGAREDAQLPPMPPPLDLPREGASPPPEPLEPAFEDAPGGAAAAPPIPIEPAPLPPLPTVEWQAGSDSLAGDLIAMIQRLDERCVRTESTLAALLERSERLERRSVTEAEELAAQRAALARLDRALGRPLAQPPSPPTPTAATPPPRES